MPNRLHDALFAPHRDSERPLLVTADGRTLSYRAFLDTADGFAGALAAAGVVKGDRVALQVAKSPEALAVYAACVRLGAALLPLNTVYTEGEVAYIVGDAEPRVLVCDPARAGELAACSKRHGATLLTLAADGGGTLADSATAFPAAVCACGDADLAAILYTSGTTGRPKGVMLSHANLLSNARTLVDLWRIDRDDVLLHALPIYHTHGLFVAVNTVLLAGGAMIFHAGFDADAMIAALPRATVLMGVPTFYTRLLRSPALTADLVAHMRLFVSGSAPLLAETHAAFLARTGHRILERYGMTETNMNASNPYDGERREGTVGPPLPGIEIVITDPATGEPLAPGAIGMIEVRGPNVFRGYWRMPEKTDADLRANGFFITGDLGVFDADGYLSIVGRQKDLVISGGFNVYPKEIELLIDGLDGVVEAAVFGIPDADFGEAVVAAVVVAATAPTPDTIRAALRPQLARFKQPKYIVIVDALPRNAMGKVQKAVLRDRYAAEFKPA